jgi:tRNA threonylcarbamoyl adenosine modification protein YeaZ
MVILGINTAIKNPCVGLIVDDVSKAVSLGGEQHQTETLIPTIHGLLSEFNLEPKDISEIVVVSGPGSFTAVRIGIIAANALAANLKVPLFAVTTFEYLKLSSQLESPTILVHAGGDSVYTQNGIIIDFKEFLSEYAGEPVVADLSQEQMDKYALRLNFVSDKIDFIEICKTVANSPTQYKVLELPLEPNYIKEANISRERSRIN